MTETRCYFQSFVWFQATVLTGEGGRLRRDLEKGKDYAVVPEAIWKALSAWYGGSPALPRQVFVYVRIN